MTESDERDRRISLSTACASDGRLWLERRSGVYVWALSAFVAPSAAITAASAHVLHNVCSHHVWWKLLPLAGRIDL